jgi:(p)ppGpp synthase/HD superfamily hydrolase
MSNLATAIALASQGFRFKTDKAGEPYIMHCFRVMSNPRCNTDTKKILAMLHDTVEDEVFTLEQLQGHGFSIEILRKLNLLTHNRNTHTYDEYIKLISTDDDCVDVKLSDLEDNSQITRLKGLGKKDFDRMEKYHRSYVYLSRR